MKKILKKKNILIIIYLVIIIAVIHLFKIKSYTYYSEYISTITYRIKINKITKVLKGNFYHSCSAVDCEGTRYKCSIKLTADEYEKIMELWDDKKTLSPILETLCKDDEVFYKSFEKSHEDSIEDYNNLDLNSDGKISKREIGNQWLIDAIKENQ